MWEFRQMGSFLIRLRQLIEERLVDKVALDFKSRLKDIQVSRKRAV